MKSLPEVDAHEQLKLFPETQDHFTLLFFSLFSFQIIVETVVSK